jgi:uncharacterized protein YjbI with pentapeptide repeats
MTVCKGKLNDGGPCPKKVKRGRKFCAWHDPEDMGLRKIYKQLKKATSNEKTDIILRAIEEHPEHQLFIPAWKNYFADLTDLDLSRETLEMRINKSAIERPPWWEIELGGADLSHAVLQGATLWGANLKGACIISANLQESDLSVANLQDVTFGSVNLQNAMLASTNLQGADLSSAKLNGAFFESADLQGSSLRHQDLRGADLRNANLQGAKLENINLQGATLVNTNLREANLQHADLQGANLEQTSLQAANLMDSNLHDANLEWADLEGVDLRRANLQGINLHNANLEFADLRGARLQGVDLSTTMNMSGIYLSGAWLDHTRMRRELLGNAVGEEIKRDYPSAEFAYLALKQNFDDLGDYDAASWAYRKERRMRKLEAWQKGESGLLDHKLETAVVAYLEFIGDLIIELLCDYGESVWRVIYWIAVLLFIIGPLLFSVMGGFVWDHNLTRDYFALLSPWDRFWFSYHLYILYSLGGISNANFSGLQPANDAVKLVSGLFSLSGIFLVGLLGFVAGNHIRRS